MKKLTVPQMLALCTEPLEGVSDTFKVAVAVLLENYSDELEKQNFIDCLTNREEVKGN